MKKVVHEVMTKVKHELMDIKFFFTTIQVGNKIHHEMFQEAGLATIDTVRYRLYGEMEYPYPE